MRSNEYKQVLVQWFFKNLSNFEQILSDFDFLNQKLKMKNQQSTMGSIWPARVTVEWRYAKQGMRPNEVVSDNCFSFKTWDQTRLVIIGFQ